MVKQIVFILIINVLSGAKAQLIFSKADTISVVSNIDSFISSSTSFAISTLDTQDYDTVIWNAKLVSIPINWQNPSLCNCISCIDYTSTNQTLIMDDFYLKPCQFEFGFKPNSAGEALLKVTFRYKDKIFDKFIKLSISESNLNVTRTIKNEIWYSNPINSSQYLQIDPSFKGTVELYTTEGKLLIVQPFIEKNKIISLSNLNLNSCVIVFKIDELIISRGVLIINN